MVRLVLLLGVGLFLVLLIGGTDNGQARLGLQGGYDIAVLREAPAPAPETSAPAPRVPAPRTEAARTAAPPVPAAPAPARPPVPSPGLTEISLATVAESPDAPLAVTGLTLSLPLVTGDAAVATPAPAPAPSGPQVARVIGSTVNLRAAPSAKADILGRLGRNQTVSVIATEDTGWTLVRIEAEGTEGYVASRYLTEALAEPAAESALFPSE